MLRAHPDLAGQAALGGEMTPASSLEQASAGLDSLTAEEMARFTAANDIPPTLRLSLHPRRQALGQGHILAAFDGRLGNGAAAELATALAEVDKIAFSRLLDLVQPAPTGRLTTHVLDTARGKPAADLPVELDGDRAGGESLIKEARTDPTDASRPRCSSGRDDGRRLAADLCRGETSWPPGSR